MAMKDERWFRILRRDPGYMEEVSVESHTKCFVTMANGARWRKDQEACSYVQGEAQAIELAKLWAKRSALNARTNAERQSKQAIGYDRVFSRLCKRLDELQQQDKTQNKHCPKLI
jgi:hypothetical protein